MDRRESLKSLLVGSMAGGLILTSCDTNEVKENPVPLKSKQSGGYGRTDREKNHDESLQDAKYFTDEELDTIAVLADIILPASATAGSATDAEVPAFIEFISKDMPSHQLPLRGGIMWLNHESNLAFGKDFTDAENDQQMNLVDRIAFPEKVKSVDKPGGDFFNLMRNLVMTGYYTTKIGIDDLGYKGNTPNEWDGVPADVLEAHEVSYDDEWLAKCIDPSKRAEVARWDDEGNLLN